MYPKKINIDYDDNTCYLREKANKTKNQLKLYFIMVLHTTIVS